MIKDSWLKHVFPVGLWVTFFLDGSLSYNLMGMLYRSYSMVPYLSLYWLVMAIFFVKGRNLHLEIWAALLGVAFDWYYIGIWGIFVFIFPLVIYLTKVLYRYFSTGFFNLLGIYMIDLTIVLLLGEFADQVVNRITRAMSYTGWNFILNSMIPTLLLNAVLFVILYLPVKKLYEYCQRR